MNWLRTSIKECSMPPDNHEVRPENEQGTGLPPEAPPALGSVPEVAAAKVRPVVLWGWALVLGVLAAGASWAAEEASRYVVDPDPLSKEVFPGEETARMMAKARLDTSLIAFGLLGASLGLALGVAGGLARRSVSSAILAGFIGLIIGTAAAATATWFLVPTYWRYKSPMQDDLILSLLVLSGIWATLGGAAGLALGIGAGGGRRALRALLGGLLGAVCAAMLYDVLTGIVFPLDRTTQPLPGSWITRLLARLTLAIFVATGAALVAKRAPRKSKVAPEIP
jgi:hypothetical protein